LLSERKAEGIRPIFIVAKKILEESQTEHGNQRDKRSDLLGLIPSLIKGEYNSTNPSDFW
jgi:hypothetical protein